MSSSIRIPKLHLGISYQSMCWLTNNRIKFTEEILIVQKRTLSMKFKVLINVITLLLITLVLEHVLIMMIIGCALMEIVLEHVLMVMETFTMMRSLLYAIAALLQGIQELRMILAHIPCIILDQCLALTGLKTLMYVKTKPVHLYSTL